MPLPFSGPLKVEGPLGFPKGPSLSARYQGGGAISERPTGPLAGALYRERLIRGLPGSRQGDHLAQASHNRRSLSPMAFRANSAWLSSRSSEVTSTFLLNGTSTPALIRGFACQR